MNDKKKPVYEERIGPVRLSIWENQDRNGEVFHNVRVVRRFKSEGEEWANSNTYTGLSDLALLEEAVQLAQSWLRQQRQGVNKAVN